MASNIWWHELPIAEVYRGVEIFGLQSAARVREAKRQIDTVIAMTGPRKLYEFACDAANAPEARLLAKAKCLASIEDRQGSPIDRDMLEACGPVGRRTTPIGRLIDGMFAERAGVPWPKAWDPPEPPYQGRPYMVHED
jgi:hypothetical protein